LIKKVKKLKKVLITDFVHDLLIEGLENAGFEVVYLPKIKLDEVKAIIHRYCVVVINTKTVMDREMIDKAINLKLIVRLGSGLDIIDLEYAKQKNIKVINTPEGNRNAVGEHALGLLLSLFNNICISNREVKDMQWNREKNRGIELDGKTIGIIGFGNTGSQFAKKLSGFDVNILAFDKYKQRFADNIRYVKETSLDSIFEEADVISFHVPLTKETKYFLNKEFIEKVKKDFYLINTSRGMVVNTEDLIEGLETGKVKGAVLDVLENEKLNSYSSDEMKMYKNLFSMANVVVTPHIAGWTNESKIKIAELSLKNILDNCKRKY